FAGNPLHVPSPLLLPHHASHMNVTVVTLGADRFAKVDGKGFRVTRTVLFVCPHGAAKSRLAAAVFNQVAPDGWHATSAGLQPQEEMSVRTVDLVAGTDLDALLDRQPPRPVPDLP